MIKIKVRMNKKEAKKYFKIQKFYTKDKIWAS